METNANDDPNKIDFAKVPIGALRQRGRLILSRSLNPTKVLLSEENHQRDWRGIAHLAGLMTSFGPLIKGESDRMSKVLTLWCTEGKKHTANFHNLMKFLGEIDRWDVADDLYEALGEDALAYQSKQQSILARQENEESFKDDEPLSHQSEAHILTIDDAKNVQEGKPLQKYDAFVLFAKEDIEYATELIEYMESDHPKFGFKLCLRDRDLLGGIPFEHDAIKCLIADRCARLIVIVSAAFLKSPENRFFVNFAEIIAIENRYRKIVPCLYENCKLPNTLSCYFHLKYLPPGRSSLYNFWDKLSNSIRSTNAVFNGNASPASGSQSRQIMDITDSPTRPAAIAVPPTTAENNSINCASRKKGNIVPGSSPMKVHSKPEPEQRGAFLMIHDISHSESNLSTISATNSSRSRSRWYKKLLSSGKSSSKANPPVTVMASTNSCESITKPKGKRSGLIRRLITSSTS